ncbi:MAG: hypothetical protein ACRDOD_22430, partial [Streptosporangiaceae bacterium]
YYNKEINYYAADKGTTGFDQARGVQIDIDGKYIGMRYPYEVNLVGDAAATLRALITHLERKQDRSWREDIEKNVARWWEVMEAEALVEADPINPMRLFHELSSRLPANAIVAADSGSSSSRGSAAHRRFRLPLDGDMEELHHLAGLSRCLAQR